MSLTPDYYTLHLYIAEFGDHVYVEPFTFREVIVHTNGFDRSPARFVFGLSNVQPRFWTSQLCRQFALCLAVVPPAEAGFRTGNID